MTYKNEYSSTCVAEMRKHKSCHIRFYMAQNGNNTKNRTTQKQTQIKNKYYETLAFHKLKIGQPI